MATVVLQPSEAPERQHHVLHFRRPWLTMYGLRVRQSGFDVQETNSLLQRLLPEELLIHVFTFLGPADVAIAQLVCRQWRHAGLFPDLWKLACEEAFRIPNRGEAMSMARRVQLLHRGCWRRMFLERPHVRFDGIYVSRNTHLRTGQVEWSVKNPVHLVAWYRYYRFFPDGLVAYRTSPQTVSQVAKTLIRKPKRAQSSTGGSDQSVFNGQYRMQENTVYIAIQYENSADTEIRHVLSLRSTCPGANNRLDFTKMFYFNRLDGQSTLIEDGIGGEDDDAVPGRRYHSRGASTCVFVPFQHVADSVLNLPVTQMDFFVPG
eukprot:jgi/Botrbrau1/7952/Bobra.9_2s0110.1